MNTFCQLFIDAAAVLAVPLLHGSETPRREEILIGSCRCEIHFLENWRRLDKNDAKVELTDMKGPERVRGTIVPRGRHLVQLGCAASSQPYASWLRSMEAELDIPSQSVKREIVIGVGASRVDATEIEWVQNDLQSTYWLFSRYGRVFVIHFFGWSEDPRRIVARQEVLTMLGRLRVVAGP